MASNVTSATKPQLLLKDTGAIKVIIIIVHCINSAVTVEFDNTYANKYSIIWVLDSSNCPCFAGYVVCLISVCQDCLNGVISVISQNNNQFVNHFVDEICAAVSAHHTDGTRPSLSN